MASPRFARRREEILEIASAAINVSGARGMTLTDVARQLDLDTSSVTYYFPKKDHLVAACLERSLVWMELAAQTAGEEADSQARVRSLVRAHFDLHKRQRDSGGGQLALISDALSLEPELRAPITKRFRRMVRLVRGYFDFGPSDAARLRATLSGVTLLSSIFWMPAWIRQYLIDDFDRAAAQMIGVLEHGLCKTPWAADPVLLQDTLPNDAQTRFLHAATEQINLYGYRGASVANIAAALGVSTGSFYHHLDAKDDLVAACFNRSFAVIESARARARSAPGSSGDRLGRLSDLLIAFQLRGESPLIRMSAYQALPPDIRARMLEETGRVTRHASGLVSDGVADGSVRPVDPTIASQLFIAMIDGAAELRPWAQTQTLEKAVPAYSRTLREGLF